MWAWLKGKKTYFLMAAIAILQAIKLARPEWHEAIDKIVEVLSGFGVVTVGARVVRGAGG